MENVEVVAEEIWKELEEASKIEPPLNIKPYYDDMVKKEDPATKELINFKKPSEMTLEEYKQFPAKYNWNSNVKYSLYSINCTSPNAPVRLCHLLMQTAFRLKIFGDDAFGKVSARCKVGSGIVNYLLDKNLVFFPAGAVRARVPVCLRPLNEETFKAAIVELTKCTSDTNHQRNYVGDGDGEPHLAGLGIAPISLTDGTLPGSEILFKRSLHDVKALFESQAYLKNPAAAEVAAARQQSVILDGIAKVLNGQPCNSGSSLTNASQPSMSATTASSSAHNGRNRDDGTVSPNSESSKEEERKKTKSPAVAMAEAALKSQEAAVLEAKNFEAMIKLQREELLIRKEDQLHVRTERTEERRLMVEERKQSNLVLQKIVEKLCPEDDPTERFVARKRKLDELREILGNDVYEAKLKQLKAEFLKASAM
jgi:hypothetical protein